jgi:predicted small metal-binding protein
MDKKLYEMNCDDGYRVRSDDVDEVVRSAQTHIREKHHEEAKPEEIRRQVHEVRE